MKTSLYIFKPLSIFSTYLYFSLNSIVFIDLYLTIRNPFYRRTKRYPLYLSILFMVMSVTTATLVYGTIKYGATVTIYEEKLEDDVLWMYRCFEILVFCLSMIPAALVIYRLSQKGTSKDLKNKVCKRHLVYFFFYLVIFIDLFLE